MGRREGATTTEAISIRSLSKAYASRDGDVVALEGIMDLVTNELIDEINRFDVEKIGAEARGYKAR